MGAEAAIMTTIMNSGGSGADSKFIGVLIILFDILLLAVLLIPFLK